MKKNFKKLVLNKSTLSNLETNSINGGFKQGPGSNRACGDTGLCNDLSKVSCSKYNFCCTVK